MTVLGIVADDVTGATTVGALIAREGVEASVYFDFRSLEQDASADDEVVITSTDSRPLEPEVAYKRVKEATAALIRLGARQFSKRIDTTCRGGIGPEVEGMLDALTEADAAASPEAAGSPSGGPSEDDAVAGGRRESSPETTRPEGDGTDDGWVAVVVPAMPQSRRIVVGGYSIIDSVLLHRTAVAQDVRTPVRQSHLPTLLAGQLRQGVAHVGMDAVIAGPDAIASRLAEARSAGNRVFVVDAATVEDVDAVAQAVVALGWKAAAVDPGPFTDRLAVRSGLITPRPTTERPLREEPKADDAGTVMVVAGSATTVTHEQVTSLLQVPGTVAVGARVLSLLGDRATFDAECKHVLFQVNELLKDSRPRVLVLALETVLTGVRATMEDMERAAGTTGQAVSTLLTVRFGMLARLVADMVGAEHLAGFYLTGGDVMINSCLALDASGITLVDYVIPQIDQGRIAGGPYAGTPVVCKGGLTGRSNTAVLSVNRLFDERNIAR